MARPNPRAAPVTSATCPSRPNDGRTSTACELTSRLRGAAPPLGTCFSGPAGTPPEGGARRSLDDETTQALTGRGARRTLADHARVGAGTGTSEPSMRPKSLAPIRLQFGGGGWSPRWESNPRPTPYQGVDSKLLAALTAFDRFPVFARRPVTRVSIGPVRRPRQRLLYYERRRRNLYAANGSQTGHFEAGPPRRRHQVVRQCP